MLEVEDSLSSPVIINAAITGMLPTKQDNPNVPLTVEEIASDVALVVEAGVSVIHLHPRDEEAQPTTDPVIYERLILAVRERCPEVVISATCSGRCEPSIEARAVPLKFQGFARPDLASLTCGSLNFPRQASVNDLATITELALRMRDAGIKPEIEIFEPGMGNTAQYLLRKGILEGPLYANILLGNLGTCPAGALELGYMIASLPPDTIWSAAGIGRYQLSVNTMALALGGHVRVGLEDNLYYDNNKQVLASNLQLVQRVVRLAVELGRRPATPAETRLKLGLTG